MIRRDGNLLEWVQCRASEPLQDVSRVSQSWRNGAEAVLSQRLGDKENEAPHLSKLSWTNFGGVADVLEHGGINKHSVCSSLLCLQLVVRMKQD